jgi:hypothetical protein
MGKLIVTGLSSLLGGFIDFFARKMSISMAFTLGSITLFISITIAFVGAMQLILSGIQLALPNEMNLAIQWFMPSNLPSCIAAYYAAVVARFIYDTKYKIVKAWSTK